jgi:transcriptional regulator with XRE-family HTH domain
VVDRVSPFVQRRRLAKELRQLRLARKLTVHQVAAAMECSPGKISRVETASVGAQLADVRLLLDIYGVDDVERERMLDLVREARKRPSWWHEYAGVLPQGAMRFFGLEDEATTIDEYSGSLIPGLLQVDGYGRALMATATDKVTTVEDPAETADLRAKLRAQRQHLLSRDGAPRVRYVLDEAALAVRFGGPAVMVEQLDNLLEVADRPNVTLRVMPLGADAFAAAGGRFTIFSFANPGEDSSVVYIDGRTFSHYREAVKEVRLYRSDFSELVDKSCDSSDSVEVIKRWAEVHRKSAEQSS